MVLHAARWFCRPRAVRAPRSCADARDSGRCRGIPFCRPTPDPAPGPRMCRAPSLCYRVPLRWGLGSDWGEDPRAPVEAVSPRVFTVPSIDSNSPTGPASAGPTRAQHMRRRRGMGPSLGCRRPSGEECRTSRGRVASAGHSPGNHFGQKSPARRGTRVMDVLGPGRSVQGSRGAGSGVGSMPRKSDLPNRGGNG